MSNKKRKFGFCRFSIAAFCTLIHITACGGGSDQGSANGDGTLGGKAYQKVSEGVLSGSDQELRGTGSVLFKDPLGEIAGEKNVSLDFALEDGGSLSLVTFADSSLKSGVSLTLSRNGNTLSAALEIGTQKTDARTLSSIDASGQITLDIDIHNAETPVHVMIWNRGVSSYTTSTAVYDSEASQMQIQGNGTAPYWGISLTRATLFKAVVTEAKLAH